MSSTPNPLTRIEREAKEYAEKAWQDREPPLSRASILVLALHDYSTAAIREHNRAAPVVKALEEALQHFTEIKKTMCAIYPELADKFDASKPEWFANGNTILQTYKADV